MAREVQRKGWRKRELYEHPIYLQFNFDINITWLKKTPKYYY